MASQVNNGEGEALVLYDAGCGFCRWSLAKLLAWDRRGALRPVPIGSAEGEQLLAGLSEEERWRSWHLASGDLLRSGGAALAPLLRLLPGGAPLAGLAARMPRLANAAYFVVAARRGVLGRLLSHGAVRRADERIKRRSAAQR